jgi:hypothetical protein
MFSSIRLLGVIPLLASATMAERSLPADLQVDLIFPRHDTTYTPTQWFPVVFGVKNLDAVWSMGINKADIEFLYCRAPITHTSPNELSMAPCVDNSSTKGTKHYIYQISSS